MTTDARFQDGQERPLNLGAEDPEDLKVMSALVQDAVFPAAEMRWIAKQRRFALLLNRFRWEDQARRKADPERVQSVLTIDEVLRVASQGVDRADKDMVYAILALQFEPGTDGSGTVELTLAGDGAIRLEVEALGLNLRDVTRPYAAPSGSVPNHDG